MNLQERLQPTLPERYRLERQLGEGGMAIVFLATDLKHDREVAVKVLRPALSSLLGADRFLQEIRVTARLQHPHIMPLYDSGAAGELLYYVMPRVRGESLRERLTRERQLPIDEAVSITRAIAGALDYAHRQGVLHRDIKPENILLHDGQPMLADFGIAVAVSTAGGDRLTQSGIFVGTPSYMSPEHASGDRTLDARSDIYALACVTYEMMSGDPPFTGPTAQAVFAAMMTTEARPLEERRRSVPPLVASAVHRALEPLPADRFATAAEFGAALSTDASRMPRWPRRSPSRRVVPWLGAVGAAAGLGVLIGFVLHSPAQSSIRRLNLVTPSDAPVALTGPSSASGWQTALAISPAGDRLVYVTPHGHSTALAMRALDGDSPAILPGTDGAYLPFFSADGGWIGFFSGNLLRKVAAAGGTPVTLAQVDRITGAAWPALNRILVLENEGFDLHLLSESGSTDSTVHLATQFGTPDVLPGGRWAAGQLSSGQLAVLSLLDGTELAVTRRGVLPLKEVRQNDLLFGASPHWLASGYLVYATGDGVLAALPFDGSSRRVRGAPVPLTSGVRMEAGFGYAEFSLAHDGTLVYIPGANQLYVNIAFVAPDGRVDTLSQPRGPYTQPRISPDGTRLAVQERNAIGGWQVLLINLASGVRQSIQVEGNYRAFPASWLPSSRELMIGLWDPVQFINYGARIESLETGKSTDLHLNDASYMTIAPDGHSFVFSDWRTGDLYVRSLGPDTTRISIPARGFAASFSPDGRWLAWGGVDGAVAVSPFPPTGAVYVVAERGQMPVWTPKGDALIYRNGSGYYRSHVSITGGFHADPPQLLVDGPFLATFAWNHAMSPDGRLLVLLNSPERQVDRLNVITGFPTLVDRIAQAR